MSEPLPEKTEGEESKEAQQSFIPVVPPVSKRQRRRQQKDEERKAKKAITKRIEKEEKLKAREEALKEYLALPEEERERRAEIKRAKMEQARQEKETKKKRLRDAVESGPKLVIDMGFANLMYAKELNSLSHQLGSSYASIGKAEKPFHLHFTDFNGPLKEQFKKQWGAGSEEWTVTQDARPYLEVFKEQREKLVYLTPDSYDVLEELDEEAVYVIGGFIDRNRHKMATFRKAEEDGIKTAAFPIDQDMLKNSFSTVLTVNQCVAIMSHRRDTGCWETALQRVLPARKRKETCADEPEGDTATDMQETSKKQKESEKK